MRPCALAAAAVLLVACDPEPAERPKVTSERAVMRAHEPVPPGSVPRGAAAARAAEAAEPGDLAVLAGLGGARYTIFCTPCHGAAGHGDGAVVSRGFPPPPSFGDGRLRAMPPAEIAAVIADGRGRMFPMADRVPAEERWAIAAYDKALQAAGTRGAPPGLE